jgi:hypothetical protein
MKRVVNKGLRVAVFEAAATFSVFAMGRDDISILNDSQSQEVELAWPFGWLSIKPSI